MALPPPAEKPPRLPAAAPGPAAGKKSERGWQLPLDGSNLSRAQLHPAQRKKLEAPAPSRRLWFLAVSLFFLLILTAGALYYWQAPLKQTLQVWMKGPRPTPPPTGSATSPAIDSKTGSATQPAPEGHASFSKAVSGPFDLASAPASYSRPGETGNGRPTELISLASASGGTFTASLTAVPASSTDVSASSTAVPASSTAASATSVAIPASSTTIPSSPGRVASSSSGDFLPGLASCAVPVLADPSLGSPPLNVHLNQNELIVQTGTVLISTSSIDLSYDNSEAEVWQITQLENNLVFGGKPRDNTQANYSTTLYNQAYAVGYSEDRRNPAWVGYRLDPDPGGPALPRPGKFSADDRTAAGVTTREYTNTGYDRGHLAPNSAIARRFGAEAQRETFFLSNIVPQKPDLNRKVWQRLERLEDRYATVYNGVYVVTGPIYDEYRETLSSRSRVEIPDAFYKILVDAEPGSIRLLPFIIPQTVSGKEPLVEFLTSVDEIEQATGLDFFWALSDSQENRLEADKPSSLWENP